jgi:hypothetical protein
MRLTRPRKSSAEATQRTVQRRTAVLQQARKRVSGGESSTQLRAEMDSLTKQERQSLLHEAGFTVDIPPDVGLALKADLALPWRKLRILRR